MIFKTQINFSTLNVTPLSPVTMAGPGVRSPKGPRARSAPRARHHLGPIAHKGGCYCGTNLAEQSTLITSNNAASINHFQISLHCRIEDVEDVVGWEAV